MQILPRTYPYCPGTSRSDQMSEYGTSDGIEVFEHFGATSTIQACRTTTAGHTEASLEPKSRHMTSTGPPTDRLQSRYPPVTFKRAPFPVDAVRHTRTAFNDASAKCTVCPRTRSERSQ